MSRTSRKNNYFYLCYRQVGGLSELTFMDGDGNRQYSGIHANDEIEQAFKKLHDATIQIVTDLQKSGVK